MSTPLRRDDPVDRLMSVSPDLPHIRQNLDVITANWRIITEHRIDGGRDLAAESNRAMEWFGNDGLFERLRYDRDSLSPADRVAVAGLTQVRTAMESHTLTAEIQQEMRGILDELRPAVDALEARRNAVLAAAHTGLRDRVIDQSELADIRGFAGSDKAAVERHEAIRKLADGGHLDPALVSPAVPPGLIDTERMAGRVSRLHEAITPQIEASRAAWLTSVGATVVASADGYPSPAHHQRAMRRLEALSPSERSTVLDAAGRLDLAKQVLGKDKREVDALLERASGDATDALTGEGAGITALSRQVGAMEKGLLHMLSRPEVSTEHLLAAAGAISGADPVLLEPRSTIPTDQKLNPIVGAGVDLARAYTAAIDETRPKHALGPGAASKISKEMQTSLRDTAALAAPEALKKGLERVEKCSPALGKLVADSRLRLGPPSEGEPTGVTAARDTLDANLVRLGQMDKRTAVRWAREQGPLLGEIAADARQAQKATQESMSPVRRIADKVAHEFAKHELSAQSRHARDGVDVTLGPTGYVRAAVEGVGKGLSEQVRNLVRRVHTQDAPPAPAHPAQSQERPRQLGI